MGLPDNRDIEPIRDNNIDDYNNQPEFVMNQIEENEQMETDEDSDLNDGYLRLQTFDNGDDYQAADDSDSSGSDDEEGGNEYAIESEAMEENVQPGIPPIVSADEEIQAQIWNTPRSQQSDTIELNTEKTQEILKAMSKINLPNIPAWAKEVDPGELIQRIRNKDGAPSDRK